MAVHSCSSNWNLPNPSLSSCLKRRCFWILWRLVVEPTQLKNMIVKLDHLPKVRGDNGKGLKPPSSFFICWWVHEFHHFFRVRVFSSSKRKHRFEVVAVDTRSPDKHPFPWPRFFKATSFGPISDLFRIFQGLSDRPLFGNQKVTLKKLEHDHYFFREGTWLPKSQPGFRLGDVPNPYSGIFLNHGDWIRTFCKS